MKQNGTSSISLNSSLSIVDRSCDCSSEEQNDDEITSGDCQVRNRMSDDSYNGVKNTGTLENNNKLRKY